MNTDPARVLAKRGGLSVAAQLLDLRKNRSDLEVCIDKDELVVRGHLQPAPSMRSYRFLLRYRMGLSPKIWIKEPALTELSKGRKIPHLYSQKAAQLCLFYPPANEWTKNMLLRNSFLAWASEWLYHFEIWLVTNIWTGGGISHG